MDIIQEQDAAYYKSIHDDLEKEFKAAEEKIKKEKNRKIEEEPEPPKPTREQLRALRLSKLDPKLLS